MTSLRINPQCDQMQLVDALQRIAEENDASRLKACHTGSTRAACLPDVGLFQTAEFESSFDDEKSHLVDYLSTEDGRKPGTQLSYDPICTIVDESAPLQVDQNGAKVRGHSLSSSWMPNKTLLDISHQTPKSTQHTWADYSPRAVSCATVSAAAMTAAMIMESENSAPKRPRSATGDPSSDIPLNFDDILGSAEDESYSSDLSVDDADVVSGNNESRLNKPSVSSPDGDIFDGPGSPVTPAMSPLQQETLNIPELTNVKAAGETAPARRDPGLKATKPSPIASFTHLSVPSNVLPFSEVTRNAALSKKRRAEAMERFRRKKAVRCYGRRVRYQIRKKIATTRPRVNGRFAKKSDVESLEAVASHGKE